MYSIYIMEKFNSEILKNLVRDKSTTKILKLTAKKAQDNITLNDIKSIITAINKKDPSAKVRIRGLADSWKTLKGFNSDLMTDEDIDEYLNGRVRNTSKFKSFSQIEISSITLKK